MGLNTDGGQELVRSRGLHVLGLLQATEEAKGGREAAKGRLGGWENAWSDKGGSERTVPEYLQALREGC